MKSISTLGTIDYLVVGHITIDILPDGKRLGGTAIYSALTASALGLRAGIVTSWGAEISHEGLSDIPIASFPADQSTTFENIETPQGRVQYIRSVAHGLDFYHIPEPWRKANIVHLGPVAQEVEPTLVRNFSDVLLGVTPQGWLRKWGRDGLVDLAEWPEATFVLGRSGAAVISAADLNNDEERIEEMAASCRVLAVTEADLGVRLYWNGDVRRFHAPEVDVMDTTGAGDIFGAAFFVRLYSTRDPWEAARFATNLASQSVTRPGLEGIPTQSEINASKVEVF